MSKVQKFLSPEYEPVRAWLYGVGVAGIALAVALKLFDVALGAALAAFLGSVLLFPLAEVVRRQTASYARTASLKTPEGKLVQGPAAPAVQRKAAAPGDEAFVLDAGEDLDGCP